MREKPNCMDGEAWEWCFNGGCKEANLYKQLYMILLVKYTNEL